ncbi:hypothetical protein [Haloplanus rubicundus]|uniref:hypothetical protein n=1 Tax=Haloplanus rubicundus TaxID=1547898 RepID=UPI001300641F|nr:hypothetical protein [Haloplanus rubicundus]
MPSLSIELDQKIAEACERRTKETEFETIEGYISFIVEEVATINEEVNDTNEIKKKQVDHLRALGYLDEHET